MTGQKFPNMNEFSPGTIGDLEPVLAIAARFPGDRTAQIRAIAADIPKITATTDDRQRNVRAGNVLIGMSQCGLYDLESHVLTSVGLALAQSVSDDERYELLAKHILQHCHGDTLVDVVGTIRGRAESVTLDGIRDELRSRGFIVTENETNSSKLRQWLEKGGVFSPNWTVNEGRLAALVGGTSGTFAKWRSLPRHQRIFAEQVKRLDGGAEGWVSVRQVKTLCETQHGRRCFPEGRLRDAVVAPLELEGWIKSRGRGSGRGGDSGDVRALPQLKDLVAVSIGEELSVVPAELRRLLSTPLAEIFDHLDSDDTHAKGIALELLALRIIRDVGLYPAAFRLRGTATQGAEVDVIANGVHLHYSRWLFQCKNTSQVRVNDIAKEVGMAVVMRAHVICMVTTGRFTSSVEEFAKGVAETSALQVVLIDRDLLEEYRRVGPSAVIDHLRSNAASVLRIKASQVDAAGDASAV